jgi:hypothetical protein
VLPPSLRRALHAQLPPARGLTGPTPFSKPATSERAGPLRAATIDVVNLTKTDIRLVGFWNNSLKREQLRRTIIHRLDEPGWNREPSSQTPRLVAAIVDRVTFNAHILETGTQSYRLRTSKTTTRRKRT